MSLRLGIDIGGTFTDLVAIAADGRVLTRKTASTPHDYAEGIVTGLTELLLPADGVGELRLLWPTLARLSQADGMIALIAPPYLPYAPAWANAGIRLQRLQVIHADPRNALWATEQCLRSAACSAVLCWPRQVDDRALRRLQVAAETGQCLGFAMRPITAAMNPSPAALRIAIDADPAQLRVLKCRGGNPPARAIPFSVFPARLPAEGAALPHTALPPAAVVHAFPPPRVHRLHALPARTH